MQAAPHLRRRRGRGARLPRGARARPARRRASRASASRSIRALASARRWRIISHCCARSGRSRRPGYPVLAGLSRKSSLGEITGRERRRAAAGEPRGGAGRGRARRGDRPRARRARDGRCAQGVARGRAARCASDQQTREMSNRETSKHDATILRHRRHPRSRRRAADHARARAEARLGGGPRARRRHVARRRAPGGADRQGHAHLGLSARSGARGGTVRRRRRRLSVRAAAHAGGRLPDARAAPVRRHRHQRVAQSVRRQRDQVLLATPARSFPTASSTRSRARWTQPLACVPSAQLGKARRIDDAGGRYIEFCKSTFPNELDLKGWRIVVDCAHGAAYHVAPPVFHELGADVDRDRRRAERHQHQRRRGRDAPRSI